MLSFIAVAIFVIRLVRIDCHSVGQKPALQLNDVDANLKLNGTHLPLYEIYLF